MKSWREKFQAMAVAVTFAETGEWETAKSFVQQSEERRDGRAVEVQKRRDQRPRKPIFRT